MEFLNNIWGALIVENTLLTNTFLIFSKFIEVPLYMLLFTQFLNISAQKSQKISYVFSFIILTILSDLFITIPTVKLLVNLIIDFILIKFIFKSNILLSIFALILPYAIVAFVSYVFSNVYFMITGNNFNDYANIPIQRIIYLTILYISMILIYLLSKKTQLNTQFLNIMNKKNRNMLILNSLFGIFMITVQSFLITYYNTNLPIAIGFLSFICLIAYFVIGIYSITSITKLELATQELESAEAFNKSLSTLHDNVRGFKHDFDNIIASIGRIC